MGSGLRRRRLSVPRENMSACACALCQSIPWVVFKSADTQRTSEARARSVAIPPEPSASELRALVVR